jgi:putative Ca2+/H+ antiporter (TMEM165/GDT1 family)
MTMVHLIQAKRSPVIIGGVMAAVVASALVPLVVQFAGGGRSDFACIGARFRWALVLVGLHLVTDVLIGLSYVVISATLMQLVRKAKQDLPFLWAFVAFGIFIVWGVLRRETDEHDEHGPDGTEARPGVA